MIYNYMSPIDSAVESSAETVATSEDINDNVSDSEYVSSRILVPARTVTVTVTVAATPEEFSESLEANFGSLGSVDEGSAIGIVESADIESSSLAAIESSAPADVESTAEPSGFASFVEPAESLVDEGSTIVPGLRNIGKAGVVAAQPEDNDDSIDDFDYASWSSRIDAAAHKLASNVGGMIVEMITQVPASAAATQTADAENIEPTHVF
ncbi:hypothetical protein EV175_002251 [Coemansia sp. RSA 1933]|nr:hypothetical protein EV175_002251 [Coemansia sp. RSA 1933]